MAGLLIYANLLLDSPIAVTSSHTSSINVFHGPSFNTIKDHSRCKDELFCEIHATDPHHQCLVLQL